MTFENVAGKMFVFTGNVRDSIIVSTLDDKGEITIEVGIDGQKYSGAICFLQPVIAREIAALLVELADKLERVDATD